MPTTTTTAAAAAEWVSSTLGDLMGFKQEEGGRRRSRTYLFIQGALSAADAAAAGVFSRDFLFSLEN